MKDSIVLFDGEVLTIDNKTVTADQSTISKWKKNGLIKYSFGDTRTGIFLTFTNTIPSIDVQRRTLDQYNFIVNSLIELRSPLLKFYREEVGIVPVIQIPDSCKNSVYNNIVSYIENKKEDKMETFTNKRVYAIKDTGEDIIHSKTDLYISLFDIEKKYGNMDNNSVLKFRKELIYNELNTDFWSFTQQLQEN